MTEGGDRPHANASRPTCNAKMNGFLACRLVAELPVKIAPLMAEVEATKVRKNASDVLHGSMHGLGAQAWRMKHGAGS